MESLATVSVAFQTVIFLVHDVLVHLKNQEDGGSSSTISARKSVEDLQKRFLTFQASIKEEENRRASRGSSSSAHLSKDFVKNIRELAFKIEDALDEFMFHVPHHFHTSRFRQSLHNIHAACSLTYRNASKTLSSKRDEIVQEMDTLLGHKLHKDRLRGDVAGTSRESECLKTDQMLVDDEIVGYTTLRKDLVRQLIGEDGNGENHFKRVTVQVVGPGGSGKTFLVKNVYRKRKVEQHFDCRAWIRVTQSFKLEEVLLEMLNQFCSARDENILNNLSGTTKQNLDRYLQHKKYLIVLDEVWNREGYTLIANSLPSDSTGSRIVVTTRRSDVVDKPNYTHKLEGLTKEEAWDLFCKHAFHGATSKGKLCPEDLKRSAEKIVEKCDNIPLHDATVGNLLSTKPKRNDQWELFHNSLGTEIRDSSLSIINLVLQPSLMDLPDHLKNCFLYFGVFPEGYSIRRGRLIRSWLAEGFVEEKSGKTLEEVAESYLNELIARNLVQASELEMDGRVRSCRVLRLYHDFIVWLSTQANFITVMDETTTSKTIDPEKVRRLSIHNVDPQLSQIDESIKWCVRTFFMFGQHSVSQRKSFFSSVAKIFDGKDAATSTDLESVLYNFKWLKVLDLQGVPGLNNSRFEDRIGCFLLLRYLNLRKTNIKTFSSSIKKLRLLEFVDVRNTQVTELPEWIYLLVKLRHLLVSCVDSEDGVPNTFPTSDAKGVKVFGGNIRALSSIQRLSLIKVINSKQFIEDLGSLTQLTKLGLTDLKTEFGSKLCKSIEKMKNLSTFEVRAMEDEYLDFDHLQNPPNHVRRLCLDGRIKKRLPGWISSQLLPSLVKVVLKRSKLDANQNPFEGLENLPNLMELKMVDYYSGNRLVFKANTFKRLTKLHIEQFNELTSVVVENEAMTLLKKLTVCKCKKLEPFPRSYSFGKLEELDVDEMNDEFISDIKRRREEGELPLIPTPIPIPGHPFFKY